MGWRARIRIPLCVFAGSSSSSSKLTNLRESKPHPFDFAQGRLCRTNRDTGEAPSCKGSPSASRMQPCLLDREYTNNLP